LAKNSKVEQYLKRVSLHISISAAMLIHQTILSSFGTFSKNKLHSIISAKHKMRQSQ